MEIARLGAEGALTESEFEAVKARLLSDEASAQEAGPTPAMDEIHEPRPPRRSAPAFIARRHAAVASRRLLLRLEGAARAPAEEGRSGAFLTKAKRFRRLKPGEAAMAGKGRGAQNLDRSALVHNAAAPTTVARSSLETVFPGVRGRARRRHEPAGASALR